MKNMRQRKAFTIVEMVIVIAVIAILATVLIPTISGVIKKANISADTQFAASLNIQLAMWEADPDNGKIESEEDLRKVFAEFYDDNFYDNLTPKSGKHGYHYWYDAEAHQVVLGTYEDLVNSEDGQVHLDADGEAAVAQPEYKFEAADPRSLMVQTKTGWRNYFLMDQGGSEVAELLSTVETMGPSDFDNLLDQLAELEETALAADMQAKLLQTAVVTANGIFRFAADDVEYVYITSSVTVLGGLTVYEHAEGGCKAVESGVVTTNAVQIELPEGVKVNAFSFTGFANAEDTTELKENTAELHVKASENQLASIFEAYSTDCVIVLPNDARYIIEGTQILRLPERTAVGDKLGVTSIDKIEIDYTDNDSNLNADQGYLNVNPDGDAETNDKILYLAHDVANATLTLKDSITAGMVNWTVADGAPFTVDETGKITITGMPDKAVNYTYTVTATLKDSNIADTIRVYIVMPISVTATGGQLSFTAPNTNADLNVEYTKTSGVDFSFGTVIVAYNQPGYVTMATAPSVSCTTTGDYFSVTNEKLTLSPDKFVNAAMTQEMTVTCGDYVNYTFTVTVTDNSESPFVVNNITDDVQMGETYLFRVGNSNNFTLDKLFGTTNAASNITLKIYDAAIYDTFTKEYQEINVTSNGFEATYTPALTSDTWETSEIKFSGTGVAIIEITTQKGIATKLAVEVVDGYNITAASQLKNDANNVLLNDITLASGGSFTLSGNSTNSNTLFGNGFTFDIRKGRTDDKAIIMLTNANLDNVRIVGSVYTETAVVDSDPYSSSAVYIKNGTISNSYISNCRSAIRVEGDVKLINTVLDGGRYANALIYTGKVTIDGVTTINMPRAEGNNNVTGLGIVVVQDATSASIEVVGNGLKQYNWINSEETSYLPQIKISLINVTSYLVDKVLSKDCQIFHHSFNGKTYVNMGVISFSSAVGEGNITVKAPYKGQSVKIATYDGYVGSVLDENYEMTQDDLKYNTEAYEWKPTRQSDTIPTFSWSAYSNGNAEITFNEGEEYEFNPHVLTALKHNQNLSVVVTMNGVQYTGNITFTESGEYKIEYTVKDPYVYNVDGTQRTEPVTYTKSITVVTNAVNQEVNAPVFTFKDRAGNTYTFKEITVTVDGTEKTYVMPNVNSADNTNIGATTAGGQTVFVPIVNSYATSGSSTMYRYYPIFTGITIVNYTSPEDATGTTYDVNTTSAPEGLTVPTKETTNGTGSINGLTLPVRMYGNNPGWKGTARYDGKLCMQSGGVSAEKEENLPGGYGYIEYSFTAGNEKTYYFRIGYYCEDGQKYSGCVTPDTLVTLADGTQKEIQYVTYEDMLLVWNFYEGKYDVVPASYLINHGYGNYTIVQLDFEDGTTVKVINKHGFFDADQNEFVFITKDNVADVVGHHFTKQDGTLVKLIDYSVTVEYTESYSILGYAFNNCYLEGMLSLTPPEVGGNVFMPFDVGADMTYDAEKMEQDIEKYGLCTYEEYADRISEEVFVALNMKYIKIAIGKGIITQEEVEELLALHFNP